MENFKFKKNFGQNFISDGNLLSAIDADAEITQNDNVLEIGAGIGSLTAKLAEQAKKVVSYEIDKTLTEPLNELASRCKNLTIKIKDALKTSITEIEEDFRGERYKIVANLPYYITSPLIFKFIENSDKVISMTVMVQKEVAERYVATPSSKEYGVATIMLNYYADIKLLRTINRSLFKPVPNVDSALIKITVNSSKPKAKNNDIFKKLIHASFSMRRKTLVNNLLKNFNVDKNTITSLLNKMGRSNDVRAEQLTISDFIYLADNLQFDKIFVNNCVVD
jgi:16S rRNA (adenine1518-N6/adenine1519-N6)-dimethyltransferase